MDWKTDKVDYYLEQAGRPENQMFFARIADRLLELGKPGEAAALCEQNIGRVPCYLSGLIILGQSYLALKEYGKAREALNLVLKQDPDNLKALYLLGQVAENSGDTLLAFSFYERVLEADPYCQEAGSEAEKLRKELESKDFVPAAAPQRIEKVPASVVISSLPVEEHQPAQQEHHKPEKIKSAWKDTSDEFMVAKEVSVDTHLVGMEPAKVEKPPEPMISASSTSSKDLETPVPAAVPKPLFETASIAEIYAKQGLFELALRVYRKLLNTNPEEGLYKNRIKELEKKVLEQQKK